ncbi:MAG: PilZ domain-containing protein [Polyangiaceae bacterium]
MPSLDHFRAFERRPTSLPALLQSNVLGWDLPAELVDLGLGGAGIVVAEGVPHGTPVRLRIDAPQLWESLHVHAKVAWSRPTEEGRIRLGLRFEVDSSSNLTVLAELIGPHPGFF